MTTRSVGTLLGPRRLQELESRFGSELLTRSRVSKIDMAVEFVVLLCRSVLEDKGHQPLLLFKHLALKPLVDLNDRVRQES